MRYKVRFWHNVSKTPLIFAWEKSSKNAIIFCRKSRAKGIKHERCIYGYYKSYVQGAGLPF